MAMITIDPGQNVDMKKIMGWVVMLAVIGALGYGFYQILPMLLNMVWGTVELLIGIAIAAVLAYFLLSGSTWRFFRYAGEGLAQFLLGWLIEMNPFGILQYRIEKTEEATEDLLHYNKKLKGKAAELQEKISDRDKTLKNAVNKYNILREKLKQDASDIGSQAQLEIEGNKVNNAKIYIENVKPVYNDLLRLVDFTERAYSTANTNLAKAKDDLQTQRDVYETVTTASATISKAWQALLGDKNLNNDADKALEALRKDIGQKIGNIRTGIKVTGQFLDGQDLENAAKLQSTLQELQGLDLTKADYSKSIDSAQTRMDLGQLTGGANKYAQFLNK